MANFMKSRVVVESSRIYPISAKIISSYINVLSFKPDITIHCIIPWSIRKGRSTTTLIRKRNTNFTNLASILLYFWKLKINCNVPCVKSSRQSSFVSRTVWCHRCWISGCWTAAIIRTGIGHITIIKWIGQCGIACDIPLWTHPQRL